MLERFDSCYATVVGASQKGLFLSLENGEEAFAFFGYLPKVSVDSVIGDFSEKAA